VLVSPSTVTALKLFSVAQEPLRLCAAERRVGRDDGEQRCHLRVDHPRTLRHAADRVRAAAGAHLRRRLLDARVGRQDGARRGHAAAPRRRAAERRHTGYEPLDRHRHADDAGGGDEHRTGLASERLRDARGAAARRPLPRRTRAGVGVAAVQEHGAHLPAALHDAPRPAHRCRLHAVRREHAGRDRQPLRHDERQVVAPRSGLDPRACRAGQEPARCRHAHRFHDLVPDREPAFVAGACSLLRRSSASSGSPSSRMNPPASAWS
jgi:hypothetical protein